MSDLLVDGLIPGAHVETSIGGQSFGTGAVDRTTAWLGIDSNKQIAAGAIAEVRQDAVVGGAAHSSSPVQSPPIPALQIPTDLLPPPALAPLVECDTHREFQVAIPGARTEITNQGQSELWTNPTGTFAGFGAPALRKGTAVARQTMPRCKRQGQSVTLPVAAAARPPAPIINQDLCPHTLRLTVSGLAPGAILHVQRKVRTDPAGRAWSATPLGDLGVAYPTQTIDIPPSTALTDPNGPVFISLEQERCGGIGPETLVAVAAAAGPFPPPKIVEPIMECSRGIPIQGAHPSAIVQAIDDASGHPLSDPVAATAPDLIVRPWFPLTPGRVRVDQTGCNADGRSQAVRVQALPTPWPAPKIVEPVRPSASWVKVTGVIPGAQLRMLVNNQLRPGSFDIYSATAIIPVTGAPLADKDRVVVTQSLCDKSSSSEGPGVNVKRGTLKVTAPPSLPRGTTSHVTVTARDADNGDLVSGVVLLNGSQVGVTGTAFSYSPGAADPNPNGLVHVGDAYLDAPFTITLTNPVWNLALHAAPVPVMLDTLRIDINQVIWNVVPDWDTTKARTLTATPSPPAAVSSTPLPIPGGPTKTVTVTISGTASTQAAELNGYDVPQQSFSFGPASAKVGYAGHDEVMGWLLEPNYTQSYTEDGQVLVFSIGPWLRGISP
jgi:hypothetical protein